MARVVYNYWLREDGQEEPLETRREEQSIPNLNEKVRIEVNGRVESLFVVYHSYETISRGTPEEELAHVIVVSRNPKPKRRTALLNGDSASTDK